MLSSYPAKTVIADLGCGDAALARSLVSKGMSVLSFDLISDNVYVIAADICAHVPLPGCEPTSGTPSLEAEGEGQVVDVVVCALSLMGTNWPGCIREAWRILRSGYVKPFPFPTTPFSIPPLQGRVEDRRSDEPLREHG